MSKKVCPQCSCTDVSQDWYSHDQGVCFVCNNCGFVGDTEEFKEQTVFHSITQSEETLAEKLIHNHFDCDYGLRMYHSTIITDKWFASYREAFAATLARLKEVLNESR